MFCKFLVSSWFRLIFLSSHGIVNFTRKKSIRKKNIYIFFEIYILLQNCYFCHPEEIYVSGNYILLQN